VLPLSRNSLACRCSRSRRIDISLPDVDGLETVRLIRSEVPHLHIVAV